MVRRIVSTWRVRPAVSPAAYMRATLGDSAVSMAPDSMLAGVARDTAAA